MQIIRGKIESAQKVVIYGPEGIGKSYFASRFPNPLFIDTEGSTKHMDVARLPAPSSWTMLLEEVKYVKANPHICDTLVIDTADWAERLCIEHICAKGEVDGIEGFGYGKGYVYLEEEFGRFLNKLEDVIQIGINVAITAHAEIKKIEQPEEIGGYDHWQMKLEKKTMPLLKEWADMLLFANYSVHVINVDNQGAQKGKNKARGGKRVMYTTHHPCWDAKNRHDLLDELELHYSQIAHCIPVRGTTAPATKIEPTPQKEIKYWHHPESSCVYTATLEEVISSDGMSVEIDKKEYDRLSKLYKNQTSPEHPLIKAGKQLEKLDERVQSEQATLQVPQDWPGNDLPDTLPRALADLMKTNSVTVQEIQRAVASKGYYPIDTPVENYDPGFINGVLVGAWGQVFQMIEDGRNEIPL